MRDIKELYLLTEKRLDGRSANNFTLEQVVPDEEELAGFTDDQLIAVVTDTQLRVPYCCWCEEKIKPNGKWIDIPDIYKALILAGKYLPKNQSICVECGEQTSPGYKKFLEAQENNELFIVE